MHTIPITGKMETFRKAMMPLIRQCMPTILANDILAVQPMAAPAGLIFNMSANYEYILFRKYPQIISDMITLHTATRPFMRGLDSEPNQHYRPWLEEHIGVQGTDWDWGIGNITTGTLEIYFANTTHATLFELTWPM